MAISKLIGKPKVRIYELRNRQSVLSRQPATGKLGIEYKALCTIQDAIQHTASWNSSYAFIYLEDSDVPSAQNPGNVQYETMNDDNMFIPVNVFMEEFDPVDHGLRYEIYTYILEVTDKEYDVWARRKQYERNTSSSIR